MNPEWVESIQRQCNRSKALFFFKQWGGVRKKVTGRKFRDEFFDEMPLDAIL